MWSLDFTCEIIRKEASADDSLELKFKQVKHLRDIGLWTHGESYYWFAWSGLISAGPGGLLSLFPVKAA